MDQHHGFIQYFIPCKYTTPLSNFFYKVAQIAEENNLQNYVINQATLNSVFCRFAQSQASITTYSG